MASPQLENGFVAIAYDLYLAIASAKLLPIEKDVFHIILYLTYGMNRTKAAISAEDVQILLSGERRIHTNRVSAAIESLLRKHLLYTSGTSSSLVGIQKDFEKWDFSEKSVHGVQLVTKVTKLNSFSTSTKRDTVYTLMEYTYRDTEFTFGPTTWGVERKFAKLLYREALILTGDPLEAAIKLKDYIDELRSKEWFGQVKMRFRYMHSRFKQWYKLIPAKTRSVREQEEITGYKFKYNQQKRNWEMTDAKL